MLAVSGIAPTGERCHQARLGGDREILPLALLSTVLKPVHPDGYRFIAAFVAISLLLFLLSPVAGLAGLILTVWCYYFFRDPPRVTPTREGLVVSPADGVVSMIAPAAPPAGPRARPGAADPGQHLHERVRLPREPHARGRSRRGR